MLFKRIRELSIGLAGIGDEMPNKVDGKEDCSKDLTAS